MINKNNIIEKKTPSTAHFVFYFIYFRFILLFYFIFFQLVSEQHAFAVVWAIRN